jgi:hypothetical protein
MLRLGDHWVYLVLTMVHSHYVNEWAAYRAGVFHWDKLRKRLTRRFDALAYLQTWEKHVSGFPHVNVAVHNERIWQLCAGDGWRSWRQSLIPHLLESGFGRVVHVEPLRPDTGMGLAGYLTKTARELTGAGVKNQVPVNAPAHFRRLRASRGLLEPIFRPGTHQGALVRANAVGSLDLSPEAWVKREAFILEQRRLKGRSKRRGSHVSIQD